MAVAAVWCGPATAASDDAAVWLSSFVEAITDPKLTAEGGDAAVRDVRRLLPLRNDDPRPNCQSLLSLGDGAPGFVKSASLGLMDPPGGSCADSRLSILNVTLKTLNPGRDVSAVSKRLTARFGMPVVRRTGHNDDTHWQVGPHVAIEVGVSDLVAEESIFSLTLARAP